MIWEVNKTGKNMLGIFGMIFHPESEDKFY
jgi:hypothetical protein